MKKKKRKKLRTGDEIVVSCPKCGHKHHYESLFALDQVSITALCENCGFLFLKHLNDKIKATTDLLNSDPKAVALLKNGKVKEFKAYLENKTGLF